MIGTLTYIIMHAYAANDITKVKRKRSPTRYKSRFCPKNLDIECGRAWIGSQYEMMLTSTP